MLLSDVFNSPVLTKNALEAYSSHYFCMWPVSTKLRLYNLRKDSFNPSSSSNETLEAFVQIYDSIWYCWKVYPKEKVELFWNHEEALVCLRDACPAWAMHDSLTLMTLEIHNNYHELQSCFGFEGIGRLDSSKYFWVAASKFLHFFNPRLFPIYDIAEVWKVTLNSHFKNDYLSFCHRFGARPGERSSIFNCTYTALAAELMQNAHPELMNQFAAWFKSHCAGCDDKHNILEDIHTYYATAFEIILLGATKI